MRINRCRGILRELSEEDAKFLLIGAHSLAVYGFPRLTKGIDIWVEPSEINAQAGMCALVRFGAAVQDLTVED